MRLVIISVLSVMVTGNIHAQSLYRCTSSGNTVYQDRPCAGGATRSGPVDTTNATSPSRGDANAAQIRKLENQIDVLRDEAEQQRHTPAAQPGSAGKRTALTFDAYTSIQRGMNAQEVLVKAGSPANKDFAARNPVCQRRQLYESWLYPADSTESNNTIVEFCDNVVINVKRFK